MFYVIILKLSKKSDHLLDSSVYALLALNSSLGYTLY